MAPQPPESKLLVIDPVGHTALIQGFWRASSSLPQNFNTARIACRAPACEPMIRSGEEFVPMFIQATCVAIDGRGVLIRGRPGGGKSDLALRLIDDGAALVSDDGVELYAEGGALYARFPPQAPPDLRGKIEVRGLGIAEVGAGPPAQLALLVDLVPAESIERLPEKMTETLLGIELFQVFIDPAEASAAAKVRLAVRLAARIIPPP